MKVDIPFKNQHEYDMLRGRKCCTSRTKPFGVEGDTFEIFGVTFEIIGVVRTTLVTIADHLYIPEGFSSPREFKAAWEKLHPIRGFVPEQSVWVHWFRKIFHEQDR